MATLEQVEKALRAADAAGNTSDAQILAQEYRRLRDLQAQPQQQEPQMSFGERVADVFTGASRETAATQTFPEISNPAVTLGLGGVDQLKLSALALLNPDAGELSKSISSNFPQLQTSQDEVGNFLVQNTQTGDVAVLNKPGLSGQDFFTTVAQGLAFLPAGRVAKGLSGLAKVGQVAAQSGAVSAGIEGLQAATGGEFNPEQVGLDVAFGGVAEGIPQGIRGLRAQQVQGARQAQAQARDFTERKIGDIASQEQVDQTAQAAREAAGGSKRQQAQLAEQVMPRQDVQQAAERLGVELTPSQFSGNPAYIEVEQALASIPGSQLSTVQKQSISDLAQRADDLIIELGGTTDKSALSDAIRTNIDNSIAGLERQTDEVYRQINEALPKTTRVDMSGVLEQQRQLVDDLGGVKNLDAIDARILQLSEGQPTYALVDQERRKIGQALNKKSGPYKDAETGNLRRLYSALTDAQETALAEQGEEAVQLWDLGKTLVKQRKQIEDNSLVLLGRDRLGAIMPKVGQGVKKLSQGDFKAFDQVMEALPKDQQQVAVVSALNDAFTGSARGNQQLSIPNFVKWYEGLNRNKAAKDRIFQYLPKGSERRLKDIYTVAQGINQASKERITTGRSRLIIDAFNQPEGVLSKLYNTGAKIAAAEGISTGVGVPGAGSAAVVANLMLNRQSEPLTRAADSLISSQQFRDAIRSSLRSERFAAQAFDKLEKSARYKRWLNALPDEQQRQVIRSGAQAYFTGENTNGSD